MVEADPARDQGLLQRMIEALRLDGWRRVAIGLLPLAVALLVAAAQLYGLFTGTDLRFFDLATQSEPGRAPLVVRVRQDPVYSALGSDGATRLVDAALSADASRIAFRRDPGSAFSAARWPAGKVVIGYPVERIAGSRAWRFTGPTASGAIPGARIVVVADLGAHRKQWGWVPGAKGPVPAFETAASGRSSVAPSYYVRLSAAQNLPQIDASQLLTGQVDRASLAGRIVLVEPPPGIAEAQLATPRDSRPMSLSEYNAAAIQTLAENREVRALGPIGSILLLLATATVAGLLYLRSDPKRIVPLLVLASMAVILLGGWLALRYLNLLLPVSALLLAQPVAALLVLNRAELSEDRSLRRFVTQTINRASHQALLKDTARLPGFLAATAPVLGIKRFVLFETPGGGKLEELAAQGASLDEMALPRRHLRALLRRARGAVHGIDASELVPHWEGAARLISLGPARGEVYWLAGFAPGQGHGPAFHAAGAIARDYRTLQSLRADLSAGSDLRREYRPADEWAGGAVRLIADHAEQVGTGLDGLETAVAVFHPIGFPLHANAAMGALYDLAGLSLAEATLPQALAGLTGLEGTRCIAMARELLLHGGEMRVNCRELDTRIRQLRVAARHDPAEDRPLALVIEAIDISEPRRLAQLHLSVSNLLDVNLRNDLEAIGFALALARSRAGQSPDVLRALELIDKAAERSTARLEEMAPNLRESPNGDASESFPIDASAAIGEASERVASLASELGVQLALDVPQIAGFTIADPRMLVDLVEAMLRIVLADSAPGEPVRVHVVEEVERTRVTVAGGIGMAFERLYAALENSANRAPGPFRVVSRGLSAALGWGAVISYSSGVGKGYRFAIDMRRIG